MMAVCPNCGNQTGEGAVFCDQCGTKLAQPEAATPEVAPAPPSGGGSVICPACGAGNVPGEAFCDFCGSPLEAPVPTAEPTPDLEPVSSEAELEVEPAPAPMEEEAEPAAPAPPSAEEPAPSAAEEPAPSAAEGPILSAAEGPVLSAAEGPVLSTAEGPVLSGVEGTCPACGAEVQPDEAFCPDCGASLAKAPIPPAPVAEAEPVEEAPAPPEAAPPAEPVVEELVAEEEPVPPPPPPAAPACPACGAEVEAGDAFCSNCGASLQETPTPTPAPAPIPPPAATPTGPRLVVAASGAEIPLPAKDEILIGREDPVSGIYPEIDLTPHGGEEGGVSRRHAKLHVEGDKYFVEDLDSTNFTFVNKQKVAPKTRVEVHDGDEIRCGRVALVLKSA